MSLFRSLFPGFKEVRSWYDELRRAHIVRLEISVETLQAQLEPRDLVRALAPRWEALQHKRVAHLEHRATRALIATCKQRRRVRIRGSR